MFSPSTSRSLATALAGAALASALVVSGASADQHAIDAAARDEAGLPSVAPPPPTVDVESVVDEPSATGGFDWASAAIGAAAGTGLLILLMAFGPGRIIGRPARA